MASNSTALEIGLRGRVTAEGFLVTKVEAPATTAGVEKGDVILSIMGYPVCSDATWERLVSGYNQYLRLGILNKQTGERVTRYCHLPAAGQKKT